ncbi:Dolichyl-phosphate beta-glucosyltransferase [Trametes pubescens]|uniref:dolichyl-phosphate beta-glucosyltransferase n=1 Tax=Trametes pubescens TaxID=154538 RepID=A0A1M2VTZ4_TRAPU|nr:Dolichyl-phosphate beta-glucosyltransferase [Trametes pubescens]
MDSNTLLYGGLALAAATLGTAYTILVLWSPDTIVPKPSEETYRTASSPSKHLPLPSVHDAGSVDLSVIIPAYNETARLPEMFSTTLAHLESTRPRSYEVLVVDDGSSDGTADLALKLSLEYPASDVRVVVLEHNVGKGGAVRHGMLHARGARLLMVDADGASRFEDLELLWKAMDGLMPKGDEAAVVVGSRAHLVKTEAVVKRSVLRNILMYGLHTILRVVGVGHIRDTQCGFKLFSRRAAQSIFPAQHLATWIFDVELLLLAKQLGFPVAEVPIEWHEVSGSKLHVFADSLQMLRDLLILRANLLLGRWTVRPPTASSRQ